MGEVGPVYEKYGRKKYLIEIVILYFTSAKNS
jgi:hypothetical protein